MASKKNKCWRPTTYDQKYIWLAREYLSKCIDELDIVMEKETIVTKTIEWKEFSETKTSKVWLPKVKLPSIEWLCRYIWVARSSVYDWRDKHKAFSDILEEILEEQAERLINMWVSWRYNWTITKLLLVKHWYIEKQELDNKHSWKLDIWNILEEIQWINNKKS